jgi:hypothetical protein
MVNTCRLSPPRARLTPRALEPEEVEERAPPAAWRARLRRSEGMKM